MTAATGIRGDGERHDLVQGELAETEARGTRAASVA